MPISVPPRARPLFEAVEPAKANRTLQKVADQIHTPVSDPGEYLSSLVPFLLWILALFAGWLIKEGLRPAHAFLLPSDGSNRLGPVIILGGVLMISWSVARLLDARRGSTPGVKAERRLGALLGGLGAAIYIIGIVCTGLEQSYLSPQGVWGRSGLEVNLRRYGWSQVSTLIFKCGAGRLSGPVLQVLTKDGARFEIGERWDDQTEAFFSAFRLTKGQSIEIEPHRVTSDCDTDTAMLIGEHLFPMAIRYPDFKSGWFPSA